MNNKLKIKNDKGEEKEFDILFSFESENNGKNYVVYTDFTKENDTIKCYASIYENGKLSPVDTEAENKLIEKMITTLSEGAKVTYQLDK